MLRDRLKQSLKDAMLAKDSTRLSTLRLVMAAIKDRDIAARTESPANGDDDAQINDILVKMIKQRRDSIRAYEEAGRCELAERERSEIDVIQTFLPQQLSDGEIESACRSVISELGADNLKDIGRCMAALKTKYAGQMDFGKASAQVKSLLS